MLLICTFHKWTIGWLKDSGNDILIYKIYKKLRFEFFVLNQH